MGFRALHGLPSTNPQPDTLHAQSKDQTRLKTTYLALGVPYPAIRMQAFSPVVKKYSPEHTSTQVPINQLRGLPSTHIETGPIWKTLQGHSSSTWALGVSPRWILNRRRAKGSTTRSRLDFCEFALNAEGDFLTEGLQKFLNIMVSYSEYSYSIRYFACTSRQCR